MKAKDEPAYYRVVLRSMTQGVLVLGPEGEVLDLNPAFQQILGLDPTRYEGVLAKDLLHEPKLCSLIDSCLRGSSAMEKDFEVPGQRRTFVHAYGKPLRNERGELMGALLVLQDVTRTKRLETMRRDFIANVSHELKTPITAIKGFIETMMNEDPRSLERRQDFLMIIARQSQRLYAIVEDLLRLSRIESDFEHARIRLETVQVKLVFEAAIESCHNKIKEKGLKLEVCCQDDLEAPMNPSLIEQALVNLLDNAANYSEPGSRIELSAKSEAGNLLMSVADEGCGIAEEYHPRIFERFFRVDKARSRKLGGTGLGLAIVKHIALAHQGSVEVESRPGEGSRFSILIPGQ